jgi:uncharacterized damage-inducible protein DinB
MAGGSQNPNTNCMPDEPGDGARLSTRSNHGVTMSIASLKSLFAYKAWADAELFAVLAALPEAHFEALRTTLRILNHIHVVDRLFRARLAGEAEPFSATNTKETPTLGQLRSDVAATDAWYVDYVSSVGQPTLLRVIDFTFTDGDRGRMSREEILLHVVTHGGYHRGNVGQVLKSIPVAPPIDLYTKFLHQSEPARREA